MMEKDIELARPRSTTATPEITHTPPSGDTMVSPGELAENEISFREVEPVDVRIRDLSVSVAGASGGFLPAWARTNADQVVQDKVILNGVSADMLSGTLTAIIGGSGSGKTSMLNVMSHRMSGGRLKISGVTTLNGSRQLSSIRSSYVMQQDILLPTLTVRETLMYAADLRLPPPTTEDERRRVVEEVILELGLKECANTRIGNYAHKGCSGGEKRRTSIGVQLLANPSVLFLDEPTTGLDATSAFQLVSTLKNLAEKGRTIVMTIHQPRSEIWGLFDGLVLLTHGHTIYSGKASECLRYFEGCGHDLPAFVNPAEFLIDLAAVDNRSPELEEASKARVDHLIAQWNDKAKSTFFQPPATDQPAGKRKEQERSSSQQLHNAGLIRQTRVLTARTFRITWRDPLGLTGSLIEAISMGIICGWVFFMLDGSLSGIRSREGALYIAASLQGYLILIYETYRLSIDIQLFDREHGEGVVDVIPFLASRRLARMFIEDVPVPLIFSCIFYFMTGFRPVVTQFFTFFAIILVNQYIAVNLAMLCVSVVRNFPGASLIANMGFTLQSMACGYFVQSNTIPAYTRWLKWVAYVYYGFGAMVSNEFSNQFYACPFPGGASNPACKEYTGAFIMESLGFPQNWIKTPIFALLGFAIAFYVGAGVLFRYWVVGVSISRARTNDTDKSAGKEKMAVRSIQEVRTVEVDLERYTLDIEKRNWWGKKIQILQILQPVNAKFEPGVLNVIMGPSGSGKTSLLNSMAQRLHSNLSTRYRKGGFMKFNKSVPSETVVRSICSFVTQDDDALLPSLTVRETLYFAAGLRLPSWMSSQEKRRRADEVLLKMGLKDCADNLIGSDLVKGISGGEKRRVTIAVQILTEPRVLLLDEPTSGLDAFTASSILNVLKGLAEEGRTLILTIHQSRSDLFGQFGNVLLLARGGAPVYAGKGLGMLPHFASLGFECPRTTNPSDFALDLITVDLRQEEREAVSREKVRSLILSWNAEQFAAINPSVISVPAELGSMRREMAPFRVSFPILVRRGYVNFVRQPPLVIARIMQVFGLGIIFALFFAPLHSDYYSIQNRFGFIQEFAALYFVGMLQNVAAYPNERDVFYREYDDQAYSVEAFLLQYATIEIPLEIITSILFAIMADLAVGLARTPQMFFVAAFNCFAIVNCGESVGIMFNTLFQHTGFAVNVTSVILSVATFMSGILSIGIPSFLQAFNHLSPIKYAIGNLAPYSLRGVKFTCTAYQRLPNGRCPIETGEQALELYKLNTNAGLNIAALAVTVVVYRILAYGVLKAKKGHRGWLKRFKKGEAEKARFGVA